MDGRQSDTLMPNENQENPLWLDAPVTHIESDTKNLYGEEERNHSRKVAQNKLENELLNSFALLQPDAAAGKREIIIEEKTVNDLVSYINNLDATVLQKKKLTQFLIKLLRKYINKLDWTVNKIPAAPIIIPRPHNPINSDTFRLLPQLNVELYAFEHSLLQKDDFTFNSEEKRKLIKDPYYLSKLVWGRFFYACARYSALLEVSSWAELLSEHITISRYRNEVWMTLFDQAERVRPLRRIFPDEVSIILWQKIKTGQYPLPNFKDQQEKKIWSKTAIQTYRTYLNRHLDNTYANWFTGMKTWHALTLPPILLRIATGEQKTTAFLETTWQRMLSNQIVLSNDKEEVILQKDWLKCNPAIRSVYTSSTESNYDKEYRKLTEILQPKIDKENRPYNRDQAKAVENLTQYLSELNEPPLILVALTSWLIEKIDTDKVQTVSAYQYLTNIGGFLISKLANQDMLNLSAEEFVGIYKELIDNAAAQNTKRSKLIQLQQFHHHLVLFGIEPIDFRLEEELCGTSNANARFLTENEYIQVLSQLTSQERSFADKTYTIGFMLAYRLGLRINEVTHIRIQDIHLPLSDSFDDILQKPFSASIKVRSQEFNRLKTNNSTRTLPLHLLLSRMELKRLIEYFAERILSQGAKPSYFLLPSDRIDAGSVNAYNLSQRVVNVMRMVTGDNQIVFHSLRHAFANQLFALISQMNPVTPLPPHWQDCALTYSIEGALADVLFKHGKFSRCHAYQLMEWLGHYSPEMSLSAYVHWSDYLIRHFLDKYRLHHKKKQSDPQNPIMNNIGIKEIVISQLKIDDDTYRHMLLNNNGNLILAVAKKLKIKPITIKTKQWKSDLAEKQTLHQEPMNLKLRDWMSFYRIFEITHDINKAVKLYHLHDAIGGQILTLLPMLSLKGKKGNHLMLPMPKSEPRSGKDYKSSKSALDFYNKFNFIFLEPPRGKEIILAEDIFSKLIKIYSKNADLVINALRYFVKNFRIDHGVILMDESKEAGMLHDLIGKINTNGKFTIKLIAPLKNASKKLCLGKLNVHFELYGNKQSSHGFRYAFMVFWIAMELQLH